MNPKKLIHANFNCPCCSPPPGSIERKLAFRRAKKLDKKRALKEAESEILEMKELQ